MTPKSLLVCVVLLFLVVTPECSGIAIARTLGAAESNNDNNNNNSDSKTVIGQLIDSISNVDSDSKGHVTSKAHVWLGRLQLVKLVWKLVSAASRATEEYKPPTRAELSENKLFQKLDWPLAILIQDAVNAESVTGLSKVFEKAVGKFRLLLNDADQEDIATLLSEDTFSKLLRQPAVHSTLHMQELMNNNNNTNSGSISNCSVGSPQRKEVICFPAKLAERGNALSRLLGYSTDESEANPVAFLEEASDDDSDDDEQQQAATGEKTKTTTTTTKQKQQTKPKKHKSSAFLFAVIATLAWVTMLILLFLDILARPKQWNFKHLVDNIVTVPTVLALEKSAEGIREFKLMFTIMCLIVCVGRLFYMMYVGLNSDQKTNELSVIKHVFTPEEEESLLQMGEGKGKDEKEGQTDEQGGQTDKQDGQTDEQDGQTDEQDGQTDSKNKISDRIQQINGQLNPKAIKTAAAALVEAFAKKASKSLSRKTAKGILVDSGFDEILAGKIVAELTLQKPTIQYKDVVSMASRDASIVDVMMDHMEEILVLAVILIVSILLISTTGDQDDLIIGFCGIGFIGLFYMGMAVRVAVSLKNRKEGAQELNEMVSVMFEGGIVKISAMVFLVFAFATFYFLFLSRCYSATLTCDNGAIPVCVNTGFPPITNVCDNNINCAAPDAVGSDSTAVCNDQSVPGARSDNGQYAQEMGYGDGREILIAPSSTAACYHDFTSENIPLLSARKQLCPNNFEYSYALPSVLTTIHNFVKRMQPDLGGDWPPTGLVLARPGDNCVTSNSPITVNDITLDDLPIFTPSVDSGESVHQLCFRTESNPTWRVVGGTDWEGYVMVAPGAGCSGKDCSKSDFTDTMSTDFLDSLYFSMVVHSTIGYGDISPTSSRGEMLVAMHALALMLLGMLDG